jgi:hypothetical protein
MLSRRTYANDNTIGPMRTQCPHFSVVELTWSFLEVSKIVVAGNDVQDARVSAIFRAAYQCIVTV